LVERVPFNCLRQRAAPVSGAVLEFWTYAGGFTLLREVGRLPDDSHADQSLLWLIRLGLVQNSNTAPLEVVHWPRRDRRSELRRHLRAR
jgi:hypothetical protein